VPETKVRRRLARDVRRREIIEAATCEIAARGYYGMTVERVALACDLTVPGLLHHFPSKRDIFLAVLDHRDDVDLSAVGVASGHKRLDRKSSRAVLDELMRHNLGQREVLRLYSVFNAESLNGDHPAHAYFSDRLARARSAVATLVSKWHPEPESFALQVLTFAQGMQLLWLRDPSIDIAGEWYRFADRLFAPLPATNN
jgi:AcrR family transcriptional regulator